MDDENDWHPSDYFFGDNEQTAQAPEPRSVPFNDLPPPERVHWIVENLMYTGGIYMHVGKPKTGKTTAARMLAAAMSSRFEGVRPHEFFGRRVIPGGVLLIDYENPRNIARQALDDLHGDEFDLGSLRVLLAEPSPASLHHGITHLTTELSAHSSVRLVILDGLMGFARIQDLSDYAQVQPAMQALRDVASTHNVAILLQHHGRKGGGSHGDQALGSVAIPGQVDGMLDFSISPTGEHMVQSAAMREGIPIEKSEFALDGGVATLSTDGAKQSYADTQRERAIQILDAVEAHQPIKRDALLRELKYSRNRALRDIGALVNQGRIAVTGEGKKGDPHVYTISTG